MRRREIRAMWVGIVAAALLEVNCPEGAHAQAQRTPRDGWQRVGT